MIHIEHQQIINSTNDENNYCLYDIVIDLIVSFLKLLCDNAIVEETNIQLKKETKKQRDILDLVKYILSFFVVAIHSRLFPNYLYPWLRLAVPLFFIISAFLFYEKFKVTDEKEQWTLTKKYIKRYLLLYIFWFVLLLPATITGNLDLFQYKWYIVIYKIISYTLFSSTFPASWFITGCIYGALAIYLTRKFHPIFLIAISLVLYLFCASLSSYFFAFPQLADFKYWYEFIFTEPQLSFPCAISWMLVGSLISRFNIKLNKITLAITIIFICGCLGLLYYEWSSIKKITGFGNKDIYFSLLPLCTAIFILLKDIDVKIRSARLLRKLSTIIYTSHGAIINGFNYLLLITKVSLDDVYLCLITFVVTIFLAHVFSIILLTLEKKKHFGFLKYSH